MRKAVLLGLVVVLALAAVAVAGCGIALAWFLYQKKTPKGEPLEAAGWLYRRRDVI